MPFQACWRRSCAGTEGRGPVVEVSLFGLAGRVWTVIPLYYSKAALRRSQRRRHAVIAPYGATTAGDGKTVYLGLQNEREWERFCGDVLGQAGSRRIRLLVEPARVSKRRSTRHHHRGSAG
jgi:crotonobetainyl-CoA:carnitine CoA-transferase CaiB-like acyl-CoA transferase